MTTLFGTRGRWAAALIISLALHCALFLVPNMLSEQPEEKTDTLMNVKLVFAPEKPKPKITETVKKETAPKTAPLKKTVVKKTPPAVVPKKTAAPLPVKKAPQELPEEKAAETVPAAATETTQESETAEGTEEASGNTAEGAAAGASSGGQGEGAASSGGIADVSALTVTHKVIPEYPAFSRKRREEGTVTVIASVEDGKVTEADVENSSGFERLDTAALRAVKGWRFAYDGKIRVRIPFAFRIK